MLLIDTSVWISVFRDRSGQVRQQLDSLNEQEWTLLSTYLETQDYAELTNQSWQAAARIYFDLRRQGFTVRSPSDCCIAQVALERNLLLIHNDRDFETIAQVRSLQNLRFQP